MSKNKHGVVDDVQRSIRGKLHELGDFISEQLHEAEQAASERAHLATCGDRPFVGCNPCQPEEVGGRAESLANAQAVPRPGPPRK